MSANLFTRFRAGFPGASAPFLHLPEGGALTYGEMLERTAQLAHLFVSLGVRPGDRVAAQVPKSPLALLVYLAAVRAGAVYLPLNPAYTLGELRYFLQDAAPQLFIADAFQAAAMRELAAAEHVPQVLTLDATGHGELSERAAKCPAEFIDVARAANDLAAILYTSGTTGRSKGAMLTHANLWSNCTTLRDLWRFTAQDRLLHALPIFHTHGLFVATNVTLAAGAAMVYLNRFDSAEVVRWLPQATVLMGVPTFYTRLLAEPGFTRDTVAGMRLFVSGSAPLSAETHKAFQAGTGHAILERYGMTETNMNTSNPYEGERVPGSVGPPLPGVEVRIADPATGRDLSVDGPGTIGVIEVRGPNVFPGYWRMPVKTAEEFRDDGFFITGDLGYVDARGYVFISGRAKDLIICGGFNVYPAEVEAVLDAIPGVVESAVVGAPHPDLGEGVVAVLQWNVSAVAAANGDANARDEAAARDETAANDEATAQDEAMALARIHSFLQGQLARYKQPRRVVFVPALPRNAMGKVQKKLLRELYADSFAGSNSP